MAEPRSESPGVSGLSMPDESGFVLDLDSNPHPVMLRRALAHRRKAYGPGLDENRAMASFWLGYLAAMADATGCTENELLVWLDSHEGEVR